MIIKFKDKLHPEDSVFNTVLKGKYAHLVRGTYIVPLQKLDDYLMLEKSFEPDKRAKGTEYWDVADLLAWVDDIETERVNAINTLELANSKSPDGDLTMDQIRHTRTNIALLMAWDTKNTDIWDYYKGGMYNEVVRQLMKYQSTPNHLALTGCGCATITTKTPTVSCDPVEVYKNGIKAAMIGIVGDIEYWKNCPEVVIREICSYIKNLIKTGLVPSLKPSYKMLFKDGCTSRGDDSYFKTLDNALEAFRLILENSDRHNYIVNGLRGFASIYELLEF